MCVCGLVAWCACAFTCVRVSSDFQNKAKFFESLDQVICIGTHMYISIYM